MYLAAQECLDGYFRLALVLAEKVAACKHQRFTIVGINDRTGTDRFMPGLLDSNSNRRALRVALDSQRVELIS